MLGDVVWRTESWSGAVLQDSNTSYVDMPFVGCKEEHGYASRLAAIIAQCYALSADDLSAAGLYYVCCVQPHAQMYFFDNLRH